MASKFQKAIKDIRAQMATESAATVARLKQIETQVVQGFRDAEETLVEQTKLTLGHIDSLMELVAGLESQVEDHEAHLGLPKAS